jgi:hypothetical protein
MADMLSDFLLNNSFASTGTANAPSHSANLFATAAAARATSPFTAPKGPPTPP